MKRLAALSLAVLFSLVPLEAAKQKSAHAPVAHPKHSKARGQKTPKKARKPSHSR
jgi:hypothetical protein